MNTRSAARFCQPRKSLMPLSHTARVALAAGWLVGGLVVVIAQGPPAGKDAGKSAAKPPGGYVEEEDPRPPAAKKAVLVEDETPAVTVPRGAYYARSDELARMALDARTPQLRELFARYVVAFDRITDSSRRTVRVTPIPVYRTDVFPEEFGIFELDEANVPKPARTMTRQQFDKVEHYEELLAAEAERVAAGGSANDPVTPAERAAASEALLAAAAVFHDAARDQNKRKGRGWEGVKQALADKLLAARVRRLRLAAEQKDWKTVRGLGGRMAALYPNNAALQEEVFAVRLAEAAALVEGSDRPADLEQARELVADFESRFPGSKNATADRVRAALQAKAGRLFDRAQGLVNRDEKEAQRLLRIVETIDPAYPGLRDLQGSIKGEYTVLFVGSRRLPRQVNPITARTDAEKRAVELVYEGLMEAVPDDAAGTRYQPELAAGMPTPGGLARDFFLHRNIEWVGLPQGGRDYLQAADVAGTFKLLREQYRHTWSAAGIDWIAPGTRVEEQGRIRLGLAAGHPMPLALLTPKILPTRYLAARGLKADDAAFGRGPVGTGPYRVKTLGAKEAVFEPNPGYARRPGRLGQPFIKEVRLREVADQNSVALFRTEELHLLTDVPTADLRQFTAPGSGLAGKVDVVTASAHRRVYVLAFNYRRPTVRSTALRQAIARAVDREEVLIQAFRPQGEGQFHRPLAGPFPPESWAAYRPLGAAPPPLFDKSLAQAKFAEHARKAGSTATALRLLLPNDDPAARKACDLMKRQIEAAAPPEDGKVTIEVEGVAPDEFDRRVYDGGAFDLAYVPLEYPDDLYPFGLGAFLDPDAVGPNGRNFMAYRTRGTAAPEDETLGRLLAEVRQHADFGRIAAETQKLHGPFVEAMPFVPLWQLDRHLIVSRKLRLFFDDGTAPRSARLLPPTTLFAGVARWRLD
jgi:hypothetical protein